MRSDPLVTGNWQLATKSFLQTRLPALFLTALLLSIAAHAQSRVDCSRIESNILARPVPYCVMLPPSYDTDKARRYPVLYYLHGLGDNEQSLINAGGWNQYEDQLASKKVGEFLIITPYGFQSFYINSLDGKMRYEDFFLREFLPAMEKKYRLKSGRGSRGIMGVSMGGFGALHYAFKYPRMFVSVSTHMAALQDKLPKEVGNNPEGKMMGTIFGIPINEGYYQANNPLQLARKAPLASLKNMKIYFDCGDHDNYGFNVGNEQLHAVLRKRGVPHEFHIYPGGHDMQFVLEHFGASLEWHSRAFGLTK
jgi:S-formylglutathione hydrolase FrmB